MGRSQCNAKQQHNDGFLSQASAEREHHRDLFRHFRKTLASLRMRVTITSTATDPEAPFRLRPGNISNRENGSHEQSSKKDKSVGIRLPSRYLPFQREHLFDTNR